jgi:tetratricopeptide (TPR) repeat protein
MKIKYFIFFIFIIFFFLILFRIDFYSSEEHLEIGKKFKSKGEYAKALKHFLKALEKNPHLPGANLEIGTIHFADPKLVSLQEAIDRFSLEIEISNHPYAYHERGVLFGYLRKWEEAERDFRKERELWKNWAADLDLAWILFSQDKLDEAEKILLEANKNYQNNVWLLNGLGVIYLNQGKIHQALEKLFSAFEKSQHLSIEDYKRAYPNNDPSFAYQAIENIKAGIAFNIALAYEKIGDIKNSVLWYNKTKEIIGNRSYVDISEGVNLETINEKIESLYSKIK